jgi:flagellar rod protein FlaI
MPLDRDFDSKLANLRELDHEINQLLTIDEINTEEILHHVDTREQILQSLIEMISLHPQLADKPHWHQAIESTKVIVQQMQLKTAEFGKALQKYRHGKRSVQQYQKFL